jgi:serine/threonine protein kinase/Tol biopolymer transport system component
LNHDSAEPRDDSFGIYEVICTIGEGGMGIVYLAEQSGAVHREVAVKALKAGLDTTSVLRRFETERQALALMDHPNIATLYDAGTSDRGRPYFVMEFVEGEPITPACDRHACTIPQRLALFAKVCRATEHAHRKGIVHRDIKPSNILVSERDGELTAKIIDFGIARATTGHLTGQTIATSFGELLGTPEYMSPEQAAFDSYGVGPASDIYSLGVVLYELLAGVLPFDSTRLRDAGMAEATRIIREEAAPAPITRLTQTGLANAIAKRRKMSPDALRRVLSHDLARILNVCLQKDPRFRYASAAALADDIDRYVRGEPVVAQGPTLGYRAQKLLRRYRVPLGTAAMVALAGAAAPWFWQRPSHPISPPGIQPLTSYTGTELEPSFSPDGKQFAFVWDGGGGNFDIYIKPVEGGSPERVTYDPALDLFPAWSPDESQLAFIRVSSREKALYVVPTHGGHERKVTSLHTQALAETGDAGLSSRQVGPAWSPDGRSIVIADSREQSGPDALYQFSLDGRQCRKLTSPEPNSAGDFLPAFLPDGTLAFVRNGSTRGYSNLYVLEPGGLRRILSEERAIHGLSGLSKEQLLFSLNRSGPATLWRISRRGGTPSPILGAGRGIRFISYSPVTGRVAYAEGHSNTNVWRLRLNPTAEGIPEKLLFSSRETESAEYSPDGSTIVFVSNRLGTRQLWSAKASGINSVQLSSVGSEVPIGTPRWSPDGRQIVYDTVTHGHSAIGIMNPDGSKAHIFASDAWDDMMPSWSHDGRSIYFTCKIGGTLHVCSKALGGGSTKVLTIESGGGDPRESPDARFVFYAGPKGIWKVSVDGGVETPLTGLEDVDTQRYWTVAGNAIYFLRNTLPPWVLYRYNLATQRISPVAKIEKQPDFGSPGLAVSPDLAYLLFGQVDERGTNIVAVDGIFPD